MKKVLLIIGAGATRAEACTKQCTKRRLPPLDTDFFELCKYHKVKDNIEILGRYIRRQYSINILKSPHPRMEEIFGMVFSDTRMKPPPDNAREAYIALLRIYKRIILETTNPLSPTTRGPLAKLIRYIKKNSRCNIITFNQDILIEKAIVAINKKNPLWFPNSGYISNFEMTVPTSDKFKTFNYSGGLFSEINIMKLHGSLNWYTLTTGSEKIPSVLTSSSKIKCTTHIKIPPEFTFLKRGTGRKNWHTWPVIVPPVYEKGPFITENLSPIWNAAHNEIVNADEIIVFGYSFPQADQQSKSFFRRARVHNTNLKRLVVINPDPNAALVANEIFSPPVFITTGNVNSYIAFSV